MKDSCKKVVTSSDYISYKYFLVKNGLKDSMESYRAYHEQHCSIYQLMPPAMKEQQLKGTWHTRFC